MRRTRLPLALWLAVSLTAAAAPLAAQASGAGSGLRIGVSFGGISTIAIVGEWFNHTHALELALGTWSFRDVAVSAVYKEYFGAGSARPFVGAGFWAVAAFPSDPLERPGFALVLRAPIGVDWAFVDDHSVGAALNVNFGLGVRRSDPEDDLPMNRRFVPLPEAYYRYATR